MERWNSPEIGVYRKMDERASNHCQSGTAKAVVKTFSIRKIPRLSACYLHNDCIVHRILVKEVSKDGSKIRDAFDILVICYDRLRAELVEFEWSWDGKPKLIGDVLAWWAQGIRDVVGDAACDPEQAFSPVLASASNCSSCVHPAWYEINPDTEDGKNVLRDLHTASAMMKASPKFTEERVNKRKHDAMVLEFTNEKAALQEELTTALDKLASLQDAVIDCCPLKKKSKKARRNMDTTELLEAYTEQCVSTIRDCNTTITARDETIHDLRSKVKELQHDVSNLGQVARATQPSLAPALTAPPAQAACAQAGTRCPQPGCYGFLSLGCPTCMANAQNSSLKELVQSSLTPHLSKHHHYS